MTVTPGEHVPPVSSARTSSTSPRPHLAFLDGLRALAALYVLLFHMWATVWPHGAPPTVLAWTGWLRYSRFAVDLFIVLSGFCLMLPVLRDGGTLRGGARQFFRRRARRILPPYYLALGLSLILAMTLIHQKTGTIWDTSLPVTAPGVLAHFFLIHDAFPDTLFNQINYPLWTIAVECQIYLLFPLLVRGWARYGGKETTALTVWVSLLACYAVGHVPALRSLYGLTPLYLGLFALGMFGAAVCFAPGAEWTRLRGRFPWGAVAAALTATLIALCNAWGFAGVFSRLIYVDLLVGCLCLSVLVAAGRSEAPLLRRLLSWKPLVALGTFSYSLYLIHAPLIQLLWQYSAAPWHRGTVPTFVMLTLVGGPLIVGVSYCFHLVGERPFLAARERGPQ